MRHNSFPRSPSARKTSANNDKDINYAKLTWRWVVHYIIVYITNPWAYVTTASRRQRMAPMKFSLHWLSYECLWLRAWLPHETINRPSYTTGSGREPVAIHTYARPAFACRSEPGTNDTTYLKLDPNEIHLPVSWRNNHSGATTPLDHRPYSRQVTDWMECDVVIHPPPTVYPKAGNGALRDQWVIKYHYQNDSPTIAFTVRDLVHWNCVTSENITRARESWKWQSIYVFANSIFLFFRHSPHYN